MIWYVLLFFFFALKKIHFVFVFDVQGLHEKFIFLVNLNFTLEQQKKLYYYYYLQLNQQSPSESEVKEDDNETEHASTAAHVCEQAKKKKKKRKKKSGKQSSHRRSSEDNADIDDLKRVVDKIYGESYNLPASPVTASCNTKSLLTVQHKNLNPSYEMKRMFGSRVVQAEQ